jgi:hypothetical protein
MSSGTPDRRTAAPRPAQWPDDADARAALEEYLRAPRDAQGVGEPLAAFEADFRGAVLDGMSLVEAWFNLARLDGVALRGADLYGAHLNGASLRRADLTGAVLTKAVLDEADARDAVLDGADLVRVEAFGTDLRGARLQRTRWAGALLGCDLRGADLTAAVFDETAARGSRLGDAVVTGATGSLFGPVDVGTDDRPLTLEGDDLARWFHDHGAPEVVVLEPARPR